LVAIEDQLRATDREQEQGLSRGQIAGYLAKYATKDTDVLAQLRPNLDVHALATLRMPEHVRRLAVCAWLQAVRGTSATSDTCGHGAGYTSSATAATT
jgi:hypothetical protein